MLKKQKVNEDYAIKNRESRAAKKYRRRDDGKGTIKWPEEFIRKFRNKELDFLRMRIHRKLSSAESLGSKLLFAICIPGTTDLHSHIRKILKEVAIDAGPDWRVPEGH